jgi:hypothetical protein
LHRIEGYYSKATYKQSKTELQKLISNNDRNNYVYIDTIISPSYTSAIAQSIQIPGISGMENNMVIFEFSKEDPVELPDIIDNFNLVKAGNFDVCILASSRKPIYFKKGIHVWIRSYDTENANLMILLSFILLGHPDWKRGNIKIFDVCKPEELEETEKKIKELMVSGRLPVTSKNIEMIVEPTDISVKQLVNKYSANAGMTLIGFREETLNHEKEKLFQGYDDMGDILFVNSTTQITID